MARNPGVRVSLFPSHSDVQVAAEPQLARISFIINFIRITLCSIEFNLRI